MEGAVQLFNDSVPRVQERIRFLSKGFQKALMNVVESTVGKHRDDVTRAGQFLETLYNLRDSGFIKGRLPMRLDIPHHGFGIEPVILRKLIQTRYLREKCAIRFRQRPRQRLLKHSPPRGV